ncbi:MAG: UDP-N-acetylmuramate--L-alanine ligase [Chloroflexi bacterium]|nr:MAG: UDP-N-acetylmuramate--L-alanine ligase [Chloroflexota bacterium]MBL1196001.1 UDP-N-acetylmuramate--L-alanine ligase [Chloroflexota bacterium]NOH13295.1 UDP-N-acetylmuramate--L-alanine ligase [Chloroflexota bacterium]
MADVHFIGIGGTGISAIARVLLERGMTVSGSDRELSPQAIELQKAGAVVYEGHLAQQVEDAKTVVRSSAVPDDNVEVVAAREAGIPVLKRSEYLPGFLEDTFTIAVAGSHGKTTTTSMLAWMLTALNQQPGFIVGGDVENLGVNAAAGNGHLFVIEADEYDYMFHGLAPRIAIVTNVEHDHPDMFPTEASFVEAFQGFVDGIETGGTLLVAADDDGAKDLLRYADGKGIHKLTYGLGPEDDYQARDLRSHPGSGYSFYVYKGESQLAYVTLEIPGRHNVLNALAALAVADLRDLNVPEAAFALATFRGAGRRFQIAGEVHGITFIDDYGHHPTEIQTTLSAARDRYPEQRIWAVWQPHTYSRTQTLLAEFTEAFDVADRLVVTDIYAARERQPQGFDFQAVLSSIRHKQIHHTPTLQDAVDLLTHQVDTGDVVIVFSAGDAVAINPQALDVLRAKETAHA